jgi:hypothetical protein
MHGRSESRESRFGRPVVWCTSEEEAKFDEVTLGFLVEEVKGEMPVAEQALCAVGGGRAFSFRSRITGQ